MVGGKNETLIALINVIEQEPIVFYDEQIKEGIIFKVNGIYVFLRVDEDKKTNYFEINQWSYDPKEYKEVQQITDFLFKKSKYRVGLLFGASRIDMIHQLWRRFFSYHKNDELLTTLRLKYIVS